MDLEKSVTCAKINLDRIEQERIVKGQKGSYLDVILVPTPKSKWGYTYLVAQCVSEEERAEGVRGPILGNAKTFEMVGSVPF
jgi:hypothetical protein